MLLEAASTGAVLATRELGLFLPKFLSQSTVSTTYGRTYVDFGLADLQLSDKPIFSW
jgi:hypothetical protein